MGESGPVGRRIRSYRRRLGLTQEVLAGRAGVSPSWLSQVERGVRTGGLRTLLPIARELGVDLAVLVDTPRMRVPGPGGRVNGVRDLVEALLRYPGRLPDAPDTDLDSIGRRLERAEGLHRLCRFQEVGPVLARLIGDAEPRCASTRGPSASPARTLCWRTSTGCRPWRWCGRARSRPLGG